MTQFDLELTQAPTKLPETATPLPTSTLQPPTETPLPTNTSRPPATATAVPCNWAQFVKDVTIPDETSLTAGKSFTKVWRLRNIGGCTWSKDYALFFSSGDKMDGATLVPLPHAVLPGKKIDLEVQLVAPDKAGEYLGNWMLRSSSGEVFGIGTEGSKPFWVQIKVKDQKTIWENYQNPYFRILLQYPANWKHLDGEPQSGDKYGGADGFFGINAMSGASIDHATDAEAYHHLQPYGSNPEIKSVKVQGQEARLILPSADANMQNQSALIVRYPQPTLINGQIYEFFVLYADIDHVQAIGVSLRFN
jgi:hypothetical protein